MNDSYNWIYWSMNWGLVSLQKIYTKQGDNFVNNKNTGFRLGDIYFRES